MGRVDMNDSACETLKILDRWSDRIAGHCTEKRASTRRKFRGKITLRVPQHSQRAVGQRSESWIEGDARNLSTSGIGFIYNKLLPIGKVTVRLPRKKMRTLLLFGEIVRRRQVQNGFWEYGVSFTGRIG